MSQLLLNDDGTVTIPLRPVIGQDGPKERPPLILPEPSLEQLAEMHTLAHAADAILPPVITIMDPRNATAEDLTAATDRLTERAMITFSADPPYGNVIVAWVELLVPGSHITKADLPAWCANPKTCNEILTHFQTPLVG